MIHRTLDAAMIDSIIATRRNNRAGPIESALWSRLCALLKEKKLVNGYVALADPDVNSLTRQAPRTHLLVAP
jgi:hypothetical protein